MKLLYIHQYFTFPENSGGTRSYDLATQFAKRGVEVTVISSNRQPSGASKWTEMDREGIHFYFLNCEYNNNMGFVARIKAFVHFMVEASKKARKIDCDIALATSTPLTVGFPVYRLKKKKNIPYVFEVRDVWPYVPIAMGYFKNKLSQKFLYACEKAIYRNASAIVPLSVGMDKNIQSRYPNDKSVVIPNISEVNRFANIEQTVDIQFPEDKKIILYAGTFGNVNGIGYVIKLAEKLLSIDDSIWFYLIGKGKEKEAVKEQAEKCGVLGKNVFIFESVRKNDLPYLYSKCTAGSSYVIDLPALWDNSANKFFDTLAAGKPMIINHEGWQADAIRKHNFGYVLPPVIDEKAAKDFAGYLNNSDLLQQQGKNAYEQAVKEYSLEVAVSKYMGIFDKIMKSRS